MKQERADLSVVIPFIVFTGIWGSTWIVIRDQLGDVPAQWSVAYRFIIATAAMAAVALWRRESLKLGRPMAIAAAFLGLAQFSINFNAVYLAEQHITSGVVATFFALLLIPSTLLAWAFLGHRPTGRFLLSSLIAIAGITMLFVHEFRQHSARPQELVAGLGFTLAGMIGASAANVFQARPKVRRFPLFSLLAWSMGFGAAFDIAFALALAGPPVIELRAGYWLGLLYLAIPASVLTFSLYYPVVRKIGPARAAYSSVLVPVIAMAFSTWLEGYRWTWLAAAGALLALAGMLGALSRPRSVVAAPDAA
ncbi:MAG TPA: EamA family transporter [Sphingomicrobium sp.]|nr:EamA family transporter [Sphingomicrobium sp.]